MQVIQVRLPDGLIKEIDSLVSSGYYASKSDVVRDVIRDYVLERRLNKLVGIVKEKGDSVKEIRDIRKRLSRQKIDIGDINRSGK